MAFNRKPALLGCAAILVLSSGCPRAGPGGVALRPDGTPGPEKCPEKALEAMEYLKLFVGTSGWVQLDANQSRARTITLYDGPIESVIDGNLGLLDAPTRLYGQVWTGGPQPVIRYYAAKPMGGGRPIPICAVARLGFGQLRKRPESMPGTAILDSSSAGVYIVDEFR
jgi:hypothetical protein